MYNDRQNPVKLKNMLKIEELVHAFIYSQCDFEKEIVLTNHFQADWEADILIVDAEGFSHEIEIKLSKSDFKNDFKNRGNKLEETVGIIANLKSPAISPLCN